MLLDEQGTYTEQSQQRLKEISEHITVIPGELNNALQDQQSQQVLADIRSVRQQYRIHATAFCRRCRTTTVRAPYRK